MLQLLLTILAVSIASVMGYTLITQLELQNAMQDARENQRRLNVAAEALENKLGRLPNIDNLLAPEPNTSHSWATLPLSVAGVNSTVSGIRFLYCPIGYASSDNSMTGNTAGSVDMGPTSYGIRTRGGFVVNSDLALHPSVVAARPAAILVAAGRNTASPPSCENVRIIDGRASVEGGIAVIVSDHRNGLVDVGSGETTGAEFFVSASGGGNGLSLNSPTSLDAALAHYVKFRPASMTINVLGGVSASASAVDAFSNASRDSELRLRLVGLSVSGAQASISSPSDVLWRTPADTTMRDVSLSRIYPQIGNGDKFRVMGASNIQMGSKRAAFEVLEGGYLEFNRANVQVLGTADRLVLNNGDLSMVSSSIIANTAPDVLAEAGFGSSMVLSGSSLGDTSAARPAITGIIDNGARYLGGNSSFVVASSGNSCWGQSNSQAYALKFSQNGSGASSAVVSESMYPPPGPEASPEQISQYNTLLGQRNRARQINGSAYTCA